MRMLFLPCAALVLCCQGSMTAMIQARPDFSGTWKNGSQQLTITQDAQTLTVNDAGHLPRRFVFQLNGTDSPNSTRTVQGATWTHVSQGRWVSSAFVVTTTTTRETGARWEWMTVYSLERGDGSGSRTLNVTTVDAALEAPFMVIKTTTYTREP